MAKRKKIAPQLFGTKQVSEILQIPEWRVKNFSEGGAYGLPPTQTVGSGRGSRRLYNDIDVCRLAIANELVACGFTPDAVGRAVREIPESMLDGLVWPDDNEFDEPDMAEEYSVMLIYMRGKWRVRRPVEVSDVPLHKHFGWDGESTGIFLLNVGSLLFKVVSKINAFRRQAEKQQ